MNNKGKTYSIAEIDLVTKKKKEIYEEIWKNRVENNDKIVLGYTQENIKQMKELYKKKKQNICLSTGYKRLVLFLCDNFTLNSNFIS